MPKLPSNDPSTLRSAKAVALLMDVSLRTVRRLIADGALKIVRIRSLVRITDETLRAYLKTGARL
jgi:excisionase family DNA binding protein